ncbi:bacteriohemerythrin [Maridesulfovibrio ferrireducens]|uniref:bacteriohemerythrin n=1 Tax=Maridesulfovibrio ferrireducens TaxID=246191 RepID=UPI001A222535|nr:bacteriohemerythrin [Maridesulfovibrio ferrireducens]MBI9111310.1 hemerythrin family protein [Maridesulfovibrio ferrireducens]
MDSKYINENSLCTGVGIVDGQHQNFFKLLKKIREHVTLLDKDEIDTIIDELFLYSLYHFETEENLLKKYNLDSFPKHLEQHREFTEKIEQFKIDHMLKKAELSNEIIDFLEQWLINHIAQTDIIDFKSAQKIDADKL